MTGCRQTRDFVSLEWRDQAVCDGRDPKFWIATNNADETRSNWATGRKICRLLCPVQPQCLAYAVEHEPFDLWGGATPEERNRIRRRRREP